MEQQLYSFFAQVFAACLVMFKKILGATGLESWYIAAVTVSMITGFLLSPLRNGVASGLDAGSDKVASAFRNRKRKN